MVRKEISMRINDVTSDMPLDWMFVCVETILGLHSNYNKNFFSCPAYDPINPAVNQMVRQEILTIKTLIKNIFLSIFLYDHFVLLHL